MHVLKASYCVFHLCIDCWLPGVDILMFLFSSSLFQYQLTSGNNSYLRKLSVLDVPSSVSRMKGGSDYLYVATEHEVSMGSSLVCYF